MKRDTDAPYTLRKLAGRRETVLGTYEDRGHAKRDCATMRKGGINVIVRDAQGRMLSVNA